MVYVVIIMQMKLTKFNVLSWMSLLQLNMNVFGYENCFLYFLNIENIENIKTYVRMLINYNLFNFQVLHLFSKPIISKSDTGYFQTRHIL